MSHLYTINRCTLSSNRNNPTSLYPGEREHLEATVVSLQRAVRGLKPSRSNNAASQTSDVSLSYQVLPQFLSNVQYPDFAPNENKGAKLRGMEDVGEMPAEWRFHGVDHERNNNLGPPNQPVNDEFNPFPKDLPRNAATIQDQSSNKPQKWVGAISSQGLYPSANTVSQPSGEDAMKTTWVKFVP